MMKKKDIFLVGVVFLVAFILRVYDFTYPSFKWMDEPRHIAASDNYWNNGQFEPDNWEHPPLRHLIQHGFMTVFGDNPYGWRIRNIISGALVAVFVFLFARSVSGDTKTGVMAGLLIATDPLHIVMSRYTYDEIYGSVFIMAAIVLFITHGRRSSWLVMSALFMGCALAIKWYYVPCWFLIYLWLLAEKRHYREFKTILFITSVYALIPLSIFILSYYKWFGRGNSFGEFIEFMVSAYYSLQSYQSQSYQPALFFLSHVSAAEWFVRPIIVGQGTYIESNTGEFIIFMNNLPVWILAVPSMIILTVLAKRTKSVTVILPVLFFTASYMLCLSVKRPMFIYSAATLLPFVFTSVATVITKLAGKYVNRIYYAALAVMIIWNIYLYPFVTAKKIPMALYRWIINMGDVVIL